MIGQLFAHDFVISSSLFFCPYEIHKKRQPLKVVVAEWNEFVVINTKTYYKKLKKFSAKNRRENEEDVKTCVFVCFLGCVRLYRFAL